MSKYTEEFEVVAKIIGDCQDRGYNELLKVTPECTTAWREGVEYRIFGEEFKRLLKEAKTIKLVLEFDE